MKLFGDRAKRITTNEMNVVYNRVKDKLSNCFTYNNSLDAVDEEELKKVTSNYLKAITN